MIETMIELKTTTDIKEFAALANMCPGKVTMYSDRYIVDGKSIMGLYSLDLTTPTKVEFEGEIPDTVKIGIEKFVVR